MNFKKIFEDLKKFKNAKNISNLVILFLIGVLMLIVSSFFKESSGASVSTLANEAGEKQVKESELRNYEQAKESELKRALSLMEGVGQVEVLLYFESGEELVPAVNINDGSSSINEKDNEGGVRETISENKGSTVVITSEGNDSKPLILKKYYPKITGVMIVAEGAEDKQIRYDIMNVVSGTFNIPKNKVNVYPMKR